MSAVTWLVSIQRTGVGDAGMRHHFFLNDYFVGLVPPPVFLCLFLSLAWLRATVSALRHSLHDRPGSARPDPVRWPINLCHHCPLPAPRVVYHRPFDWQMQSHQLYRARSIIAAVASRPPYPWIGALVPSWFVPTTGGGWPGAECRARKWLLLDEMRTLPTIRGGKETTV